MRITFNQEERTQYFRTLKNRASTSWNMIAAFLNVNTRTLRAWRQGENTIPKKIIDQIYCNYKIEIPKQAIQKNEFWHVKSAGSKGALARYKRYGNLGTDNGRKKGGKNSLKSKKLIGTNFKFLKIIQYPIISADLAELFGILYRDWETS